MYLSKEITLRGAVDALQGEEGYSEVCGECVVKMCEKQIF